MKYRRAFTPGGQYFFTLVTEHRRKILTDEATVNTREAFRKVIAKRPFAINAAVVLSGHIHCIWTLPPGDADFATR